MVIHLIVKCHRSLLILAKVSQAAFLLWGLYIIGLKFCVNGLVLTTTF